MGPVLSGLSAPKLERVTAYGTEAFSIAAESASLTRSWSAR